MATASLLAELHALQDRLHEDPEELHEIETGTLPERVTTIDSETYMHNLPEGPWEFVDGRVIPKHWSAYDDDRTQR